MRAIRAASVALLGLTALACTAPASAALSGSVAPLTTSTSGGRFTSSAPDCRDPARMSSAATQAAATQAAATETVAMKTVDMETVAVRTGLNSAATYGRSGNRYEMTFHCGSGSHGTTLMIADRSGNDRGDGGYGGNGRGENSYGGGNGRGDGGYGGNGYGGNGYGGNGYGGNGYGGNSRGGYGDNQYGGGNNRGGDSRDRPGYEQHGVRAGAGGSVGGFDLKKIGLGAALIAAPLGLAWRMTRRRTTGDK
ncbi:hypothetical protein NGF19_29690 [Streptomyces sp. RY43-2]|uniref:Glycine rich protein n=1 Tax=Streptomyces macrolidinus TaxID=2952607 RepID=A0ABT0ZMU7_9ACTN|nr:hypothetical protein [Streptomyces macrolidinus]MCN9244906.1 hypothetical protein [Streptomyces macrolidinus]